MGAPNFTLLDGSLAEIGRLMAAMLQARDAVERRSWSHPQEPTGEEWWADVLADPRARKRERRTDLAAKQAFYRLAGDHPPPHYYCPYVAHQPHPQESRCEP